MAVNLKGPWLMMKYVVPHMIEAGGGSIINTASIAAFFVCNTAGTRSEGGRRDADQGRGGGARVVTTFV